MKWFIKDILSDAAKLTALIILPMAFLGPGWRPRDSGFASSQQSTQDGFDGGSTSGQTTEKGGDRFIEILHAFDPPEGRRNGGRSDESGYRREGE